MRKRGLVLAGALALTLALASCTPGSAPASTPTRAPEASPTKASEPAKPPAATATAAPAATPAAPPAAAPKPVSLKFGSYQSISDAGVYVAMEKGYFQEQGITLEQVNVRATPDMVTGLTGGELDGAVMPIAVALFNAADRGLELKIVGDRVQMSPGYEMMGIVLRKDLADSGQVKKPADLKGLKISMQSQGTIGELMWDKILRDAGLTRQDVEVVLLSFPDATVALANKSIAGAFTAEPFIAQGVQQGTFIRWFTQTQIFGDKVQGSVTVFGPNLVKNKDLGQRWMLAYIKGVRDYYDAIIKNKGKAEIVQILTKYSTVKDAKLYDAMQMPYLDPNGMLNKDSIVQQYKLYVESGQYTGKKTPDDLIDLSYLDYAIQKLGKY